MNLYDELVTVIRALNDANIEYALVGGLAVAVWGVPRATKDIDLLVRPEDLARIKAAVYEQGYTLEAHPMKFSDGMVVHRLSKVRGESAMTIDLMLVDMNREAIWASRERRSLDEVELQVVSRDALIAMKLAAGRPQDHADVAQLRELDR